MKTLAEIKELLGKITPWPWERKYDDFYRGLISQSPSIISDLLERLEKAIDGLKKIASIPPQLESTPPFKRLSYEKMLNSRIAIARQTLKEIEG